MKLKEMVIQRIVDIKRLNEAKEENLDTLKKFASKLQKIIYDESKKSFIDHWDKTDGSGQEQWKKYGKNILERDKITLRSKSKYVNVDRGESGMFMYDKTNNHLYYIKGYGRIDRRKDFGDLNSIMKAGFKWNNYTIVPKTFPDNRMAMDGWAGPIA